MGAARTDSSGGCSAGAIGAAVGEIAAESYGRKTDTTQFASMMGGIAAALSGASAAEINLASQAGANAAANNYVSHSPYASVRKLVAEENARWTQGCGSNCTQEDFRRIDAQLQELESAAQLLETQKRSGLTTEQAVALGENIAALLPVYGTPIALYHAITGESLSGRDLAGAERFFNVIAAALPLGGAAVKTINNFMEEMREGISFGRLASDGTMLTDFSMLTTEQKGVIGELLGANTVKNVLPGATRLGRMGEVGSQGIDDLYKVSSLTADYLIVEYKFGTSSLTATADGMQMSDRWILGRDRLLRAAGNNVEEAKAIARALRDGRVEKWVVNTSPAGGTTIWLVDAAGKIVPASSDVTSKILGTLK